MNTKNNQRTRITKLLLKQAYMGLMKEKKTDRITVREICEAAEVNRSTFYLHYREPNDLLIEIEDEAIELVKEALSVIGAIKIPTPDVSEHLLSFVRYIQKNEELFRTLLVENSDPHFRRKMRDTALSMIETYFHVDLAPDQKRTAYLYIVSGSLEVLTDWIRNACSLPEQILCENLYLLSEGSLRSISAAHHG